MDNFALASQEIDPVLQELEIINKLLGGFSVFYNAFNMIKLHNGDCICDWGCGGGDSLKALNVYFSTKTLQLSFMGIDATPAAITFAKRTHQRITNLHFRQANVLTEEFKPDEFDVIISSLFTHHFDDDEWINLIKRMVFSAKKAVVINDLHRHWLAYYSIALLTQLFSKSLMVQHDSKISVLRGFKKKELIALLQKAGIKSYRIKWMWAFRWQVIIYK
ncbi:methyltransferase domain-containing protein [Pseudopedobacter saltans]|nr:methyltransferase domain-containing protein [Pseudopedobacter saltans]